VLDEVSLCDKFTGSLLGKLNLTIGVSSAEIEATTEKGTIKATEYEKGYRFDKNGWIYVHTKVSLMREVSSTDTWWLRNLTRF